MPDTLVEGTREDFKLKRPGRWMLERARYGRRTRLNVYFTCPRCGAINQTFITDRTSFSQEEECKGHFGCIYCKACRRNLNLVLQGFMAKYKNARYGPRPATRRRK